MLRVRLVGELRLDVDGRPLPAIPSRRARSLLGWLALHPGLHPRSRVAAVFWPDVLEHSSRGSLRTTLATLRRALGPHADVLVGGRADVGLDGAASVDTREIDRLVAADRLEDALALCDGELLADLDDDWVLAARQAHRERVGELLAALGARAEAVGDRDAAVRHARRRLELDPLSEDAARALMQRLGEAGDGAAAIAVFETFRGALRRDLGMAPSAETRALAEALRAPARAPEATLPDALARPDHAPLVGRGDQLAALRRAWRRASAGSAGVVLVEAAAGGGKTRLLSEFAGEARDAGAVVLAGRCLQDGVVPFAPFTEALRRIAGDPLPAWVVDELTRLLPELGPAGSAPAGSPEDARHRLLEAVAAAIGETARRGPVLLVIEDLHWADAATVAMLGHVVRTVGWAPLLVAGSRRDDESGEPALGDLLDELGRAHRLERVAVPGLSAQEAGRLAGAWLRAEPARALADVLHRRTGGNPLFVEALARHLVESHPEDGADLAAAAGTEVPEGVRAVIDRRLARLPADAVGAVRLGAVAGEDFLLDDVARAGAVDDEATAEALEAAVAAGLVDAGGGPARYRFAHALVREAVLAGLSSTRRALLHRRMADALAERPDRLPERARHLLDARPLADADVAARAALAAAALATQGLAYEDAAALLGRALEAGLAGHEPLRLELLLALGDARLRLGDGDGARTAFADAATLARARGDADALARAALGTTGIGVRVGPVRPEVQAALEEALAAVADDAPLRPVLLARLAIELYHVPPAGRREALSAEALAGGRRAGGRALLEALGARHVALWSPAHTEERLAIAGELISAARAAGDREAELQGLNWRVVDLYELGELEALRATAAEHERLADALRLPAYAFFAPMWRASLALLAGRQHEAERLHAGGAELARLARDDNARLLLETQRLSLHASGGGFAADDAEIVLRRLETSRARAGWLVALTIHRYTAGDRAAARDAFTAGVAAFADTEPDANWLYSATGLGVLAERFGDRDAADLLYRALAPYGHRIVTIARGSYCTGSAQLALGMLAIARADRAAAAAHLEAAIRANDALGAPVYAAAARSALAGLTADAERAAALRAAARVTGDPVGWAFPDALVWRL